MQQSEVFWVANSSPRQLLQIRKYKTHRQYRETRTYHTRSKKAYFRLTLHLDFCSALLCVLSGPAHLNCCTAVPESGKDSPGFHFRSRCTGLVAQSHKEEYSCSLSTHVVGLVRISLRLVQLTKMAGCHLLHVCFFFPPFFWDSFLSFQWSKMTPCMV